MVAWEQRIQCCFQNNPSDAITQPQCHNVPTLSPPSSWAFCHLQLTPSVLVCMGLELVSGKTTRLLTGFSPAFQRAEDIHVKRSLKFPSLLSQWCKNHSGCSPDFHVRVDTPAEQLRTVNFQMFKLVLEKEEEPEIKLPTSAGSSKKQESSRKTSILLYWLRQSLWLCGSQ